MVADRNDELALIQACVAGNRVAWDVFVSRFRPGVVAVARRTLAKLNAADAWQLAEDVASDVFCQLLKNECRTLSSFEGRASVSTWLNVMTRRGAARLLSRRPRSGRLSRVSNIDPDQLTPSHEARIRERKRHLRDELAKLSDRDRLALELYGGGHTYREVADTLGVPVDHVSSLIARAKLRLTRNLEHSPLARDRAS